MAKKNRHKKKYGKDYVIKFVQKIYEQTKQSSIVVQFNCPAHPAVSADEPKPDEYVQCWKTGIMYHASELPEHLSQDATKKSPH